MYTFAPSASSLLYTSHHIAGWWRRQGGGAVVLEDALRRWGSGRALELPLVGQLAAWKNQQGEVAVRISRISTPHKRAPTVTGERGGGGGGRGAGGGDPSPAPLVPTATALPPLPLPLAAALGAACGRAGWSLTTCQPCRVYSRECRVHLTVSCVYSEEQFRVYTERPNPTVYGTRPGPRRQCRCREGRPVCAIQRWYQAAPGCAAATTSAAARARLARG